MNEHNDNSGLPRIEFLEISVPSDFLTQDTRLDKAVNIANDFIWDTYTDNYPPMIRLEKDRIYIPKYDVVIDTFIRAIIEHSPVRANVALYMLIKLGVAYPEFDNLSIANDCALNSVATA